MKELPIYSAGIYAPANNTGTIAPTGTIYSALCHTG